MEQNQLATQMAFIMQAANVKIFPITGGVESKVGYLVNSKDLSYTPTTAEVQTIKSTMKNTHGQALDTYGGEVTDAQVSFTVDRASPRIIAMCMGGTVEDIPAKKGAVTDAEFIPVDVGGAVSLGFDYIDPDSFELKTDTETFLPSVDFEFYPDDGEVVILSEKLAKAKDVKTSYSYDIPAQVEMSLGTKTSFDMRIEFKGINASTGKAIKGQLWRCTMTPTEPLSLHGMEPVSFTLSGKAITPAGKKEPFKMIVEA